MRPQLPAGQGLSRTRDLGRSLVLQLPRPLRLACLPLAVCALAVPAAVTVRVDLSLSSSVCVSAALDPVAMPLCALALLLHGSEPGGAARRSGPAASRLDRLPVISEQATRLPQHWPEGVGA
jgi:hypothetical protein